MQESALRKSQDTQLVRDVLLVLDCLEQLNDPTARSDFLAGSCGAAQLSDRDLKALDDLYPEVAPKHCPPEGMPSFEDQTMSAAKHLVAIIDGSNKEIIGTTYEHLKNVVSTVQDCGYFEHPRELRVEEFEEEVNAVEEEEMEVVEYVSPPLAQVSPVPAPPPPAPQAVPAPAFPFLPPNPPPVTLQQVEQAYFAHVRAEVEYGHKAPIPEVFGPQSFIFLQESEIDTPETTRQPTPRPVSPMPIPSQTFTNQNFAIPAQHFTPDLAPNPHINMPAAHYQPGIVDVPPHIPGFPSANPPPPIPMPPSHPSLPHQPQPRLPSPSFQQNVSYKLPPGSHLEDGSVPPSDSSQEDTPDHQQADYNAWNEENTQDNHTVDQLEINEWNPVVEHGTEQESEPNNHADGQYAPNKFRPRGRARGSAPTSFRSRGGGYQNGRPGGYRNNDGYQSRENNGNGGSYSENYREGNRDRYENNSQGGYQQYKSSRGYGGSGGRGGRGEGRGSGGRGAGSGGRGAPRGGSGPREGGPREGGPREGGSRPQYNRKQGTGGNQYESRGTADTKQYAH